MKGLLFKFNEDEARDDHGRWTSGGFSEETAAHEVRLQKEAKEGIAKVDALLNEAVQTADFNATSATEWDDLSADAQNSAESKYIEQEEENDAYSDPAHEYAEEWVRESLRLDEDNDVSSKAREEFERAMGEEGITYDPASLDSAHTGSELEVDDLRHADGSEFSKEELTKARLLWNSAYGDAEDYVRERLRESDKYFDIMSENQREYIQNAWSAMSDEEKLSFAKEHDSTGSTAATPGLPNQWVWDTAVGDEGGTNYDRTRAIAVRLAEMRTAQLLQERNIAPNGGGLTPEGLSKNIGAAVWDSWKDSSTSNMGLALQYAAAEELGGVHRLTQSEIDKAMGAASDLVGYRENLDGNRVTDMDQAGRLGMDRLKAYVRAQWETTQYVLSKAGQQDVEVYRALMLGRDALANAPTEQVRGDHGQEYSRLTDIKLLRNGAASTSAKPFVANAWNGIGSTPVGAQRVVLRVKAPATAVLSLPVFGQNVHEESEVVLTGSKGAWKWDAWLRQAPPTSAVAIKTLLMKSSSIVIDLLDIDRGQPHWLSKPKPKHWAGVVKAAKDEHEPDFQRTLRHAWRSAMNGVSMTELGAAIRQKDTDAIVAALAPARVEAQTRTVVEPRLAAAFLRGVTLAHAGLTRKPRKAAQKPLAAVLGRINPAAKKWAEERAGELVTGPARTREIVHDIIEDAVADGLTVDDTAELLRGVIGLDARRAWAAATYAKDLWDAHTGSSDLQRMVTSYTDELRASRADTIARTEILMATNAGQQTLWEEAQKDGHLDGMGRVWINTEGCCDDCEELAQADPVPIHEAFDDEDDVMFPPLHPNCRCAMGLVDL